MTYKMTVKTNWGKANRTHKLTNLTEDQVAAYRSEYRKTTPQGGTTDIKVTQEK